jgi:hypothetical protein
MTQAVVIDEMLLKRMSVFDQVVTQRMAAEDRPDAFTAETLYQYQSF